MNLFGNCGDNNWLIWILVVFLLLGNNNSCGCDNNCGNSCGCGCGGGQGGDILILIIILLLFAGGDNGFANIFSMSSKEQ